jgi:hypothetical protein
MLPGKAKPHEIIIDLCLDAHFVRNVLSEHEYGHGNQTGSESKPKKAGVRTYG